MNAGAKLMTPSSTRDTETSGTAEALLLTPREAAARLRLSDRTLWSLTRAGEIPAIRIGRSVRYDPRDLAKWIASKKQGTAADLPAT